MRRFPLEQIILLVLQGAILFGLILRICVTGLFRVYPYFFGYLLVASLQTLLLWWLPYDSATYYYSWLVTQGLLTCFCTLIVLELYSLILRGLQGIASLSRRYLKIGLSVAILISLLLLLLEITPRGLFNTFLVVDRAIVTSLLVFVLLLTAFLVYYPVPLNRNVIVYSVGYAVYFTAKASALLVENISHNWYRQVDAVLVSASTLSMALWLIGLSRQGEKKTWVIGHKWNAEDHEKVLEQLKAINAKLLRAGEE